VRLPHQAIVAFIAAVTRPIRGHIILKPADAPREEEEFLKQFTVLYPNEAILRHAIRGCAAYQSVLTGASVRCQAVALLCHVTLRVVGLIVTPMVFRSQSF
jgi:hypothetical protein